MDSRFTTCGVVVERVCDGRTERGPDRVAVEEPLQIFIQNQPILVTLRTPGQDEALAAGLCLSEGYIDNLSDLTSITCCKDSGNRVFIELTQERYEQVAHLLTRSPSLVRSSCALCGKQLVEDLSVSIAPVTRIERFHFDVLQRCREQLEDHQPLFAETGSTHAAGLFQVDGELLAFAEDVGRHNALDKAIGAAFLQGSLPQAALAFVSSRASFELVQKAARAGVAVLAATSGPTGMAVELANHTGLSLAAFVRPGRMNVYSGHFRFECENLSVPNQAPSQRLRALGES